MTDLHARFVAALAALEHWHADSVKAQAYDGPSVTSSKPGAKVFYAQGYPHRRLWYDRWEAAKAAGTVADVLAVIEGVEAELHALSRRPHRLERYRDTWGKTRYRTVPND